MPGLQYDINPVTHITAGAIGRPGKRTFYLQARGQAALITLLCEKQQVESLALGIEQLVQELQQKFPTLPPASETFNRQSMELEAPLEPAFRVGQIGLGYDAESDLMVLVSQELLAEGVPPEEASTARFWASRSQMLALSRYALETIRQGRPICGNCGQPMDPEGHFCPRSNGHKH